MKKTVLITGASAGFGQACARKFRGSENRLILAARRIERLEALQKELADTEIYPLQLDVRHRQTVSTGLGNLPEQFQDVDILINNAGLALGLEPAHETDPEDWEIMIDTNIK